MENGPREFREIQYFWQNPLTWLVWLVAGVGVFAMASKGWIFTWFAVIACILIGIVLIMVFAGNLKTTVNESGVYYQLWPFHLKSQYLSWDQIDRAVVRKYKPIMEFGGWGLRFGMRAKAYNVKGNMGLQLNLKDQKDILIGTQKPEELISVLGKIPRASEN